jgi:large subunit ribosomal protein L30
MVAKEAKTKTIVIRLKKGRIACNPNQRACLKGLGLKKRHQEVSLENTPSVRGMIKKVIFMLDIVADN